MGIFTDFLDSCREFTEYYFYIAEMETIFEFCASKYTIAREERICNGRRKAVFSGVVEVIIH